PPFVLSFSVVCCLLFVSSSCPLRALSSFPTRRSSDLYLTRPVLGSCPISRVMTWRDSSLLLLDEICDSWYALTQGTLSWVSIWSMAPRKLDSDTLEGGTTLTCKICTSEAFLVALLKVYRLQWPMLRMRARAGMIMALTPKSSIQGSMSGDRRSSMWRRSSVHQMRKP